MHIKLPVDSRVCSGPIGTTSHRWVVRLTPEKLDVFAKAKLGGIADTTFVSLWPRYDDKNDTAAFNTDAFAKQTILNASAAGVDLGKIVLQVSVGHSPPVLNYSEIL